MEKPKLMFFSLCASITAFAEKHGTILILCCTFILIDLATGLTKAKIQGEVTSSIGYKGFWRKVSLLLTLAFGVCLNLFIDYLSALELFPFSFSMPISLTIGIYISVNECISICENLLASGVKMPYFIVSALRKTGETISGDPGQAENISTQS